MSLWERKASAWAVSITVGTLLVSTMIAGCGAKEESEPAAPPAIGTTTNKLGAANGVTGTATNSVPTNGQGTPIPIMKMNKDKGM